MSEEIEPESGVRNQNKKMEIRRALSLNLNEYNGYRP